ncbi:hypothetical protein Ciccas_007028 [Cichlidogyrus casuarinus]|uniref:Uncharacterized protein n=1 Tax=Cichlidogyrus casuarinus TaxID=1844966 RepID=A0ABD2Q457_9PLAT
MKFQRPHWSSIKSFIKNRPFLYVDNKLVVDKWPAYVYFAFALYLKIHGSSLLKFRGGSGKKLQDQFIAPEEFFMLLDISALYVPDMFLGLESFIASRLLPDYFSKQKTIFVTLLGLSSPIGDILYKSYFTYGTDGKSLEDISKDLCYMRLPNFIAFLIGIPVLRSLTDYFCALSEVQLGSRHSSVIKNSLNSFPQSFPHLVEVKIVNMTIVKIHKLKQYELPKYEESITEMVLRYIEKNRQDFIFKTKHSVFVPVLVTVIDKSAIDLFHGNPEGVMSMQLLDTVATNESASSQMREDFRNALISGQRMIHATCNEAIGKKIVSTALCLVIDKHNWVQYQELQHYNEHLKVDTDLISEISPELSSASSDSKTPDQVSESETSWLSLNIDIKAVETNRRQQNILAFDTGDADLSKEATDKITKATLDQEESLEDAATDDAISKCGQCCQKTKKLFAFYVPTLKALTFYLGSTLFFMAYTTEDMYNMQLRKEEHEQRVVIPKNFLSRNSNLLGNIIYSILLVSAPRLIQWLKKGHICMASHFFICISLHCIFCFIKLGIFNSFVYYNQIPFLIFNSIKYGMFYKFSMLLEVWVLYEVLVETNNTFKHALLFTFTRGALIFSTIWVNSEC